jgi:hypothetical protein
LVKKEGSVTNSRKEKDCSEWEMPELFHVEQLLCEYGDLLQLLTLGNEYLPNSEPEIGRRLSISALIMFHVEQFDVPGALKTILFSIFCFTNTFLLL